jgi:hypothetical protein
MINQLTDLAIQRVESRSITITDRVSLPPNDDYCYLGGGDLVRSQFKAC